MYNCCISCWITVLVLPIHVFEEAMIETSKIHNLFIQYPNNTYFSIMYLEGYVDGCWMNALTILCMASV
jgi:hypothetical protein